MQTIWTTSGVLLIAGLFLPGVVQAQTSPVPIAHPERWITYSDYPQESVRLREKGIVGFRLEVDAQGGVTACSITSSSGFSRLDRTACALLMKRARFKPATDANGAAVAGAWSSRFRWWVES